MPVSQGCAMSIAGDYQKNNWRGMASMEKGPGEHFLLTKTRLINGRWHHVVNTFDGTNDFFCGWPARIEAALEPARSRGRKGL